MAVESSSLWPNLCSCHIPTFDGKSVTRLALEDLIAHLDDVIVVAPDFSTHVQRLRQVLERLQGAGLKLKSGKCDLFRERVKYLGHVVSSEGVSTDPEKVAAVAEWPTPTSITQLKAFLETAGYYRQYIDGFATISRPLTQLTCADSEWVWDEATQAAFELLRDAPVLQYPDHSLPYILDTDASQEGVGAVLSRPKGDH